MEPGAVARQFSRDIFPEVDSYGLICVMSSLKFTVNVERTGLVFIIKLVIVL